MATEADFESEEVVFEPLKAYKNIYQEAHHKNVSEYFETLVAESNIDIQANKETVNIINNTTREKNNTSKKIRGKKNLTIFLIVLSIISLIGVAVGIFYLANILIAVVCAVLALLFIILIFWKIRPKQKALKVELADIEVKLQKFYEEAWGQMRALNQLFKQGVQIELFKKTLPQIKLDKLFDMKRLDYLVNKFGLNDAVDKNKSILYVQSGEMNGNPFFFGKDLVHRLGTKTYTGSIVIRWTTTQRVNGKMVRKTHSQTLIAKTDKPCPFYTENSYLVYGNEAAPDLIFSRENSNTDELSQKQIDKKVNKDIKALNKKADKDASGSYTVLGNSEFEVLFRAINRNNEVQFRLLFTPLAQKQLLELLKDNEIGFGDSFDFIKYKKINKVIPDHLANIELDLYPRHFQGFDFEQIKNNFININNKYFKHIYFTFAPILAIPIYQQQKPHEFIYKDLYNSYVSFYEHEYVANKMNINEFKHPLSTTRNILKTSVVSSGNFTDSVKVTAYGYRTENRTEYQNVYGNDGKTHSVPIHWVEYFPVEKSTDIKINVPDDKKAESSMDQIKDYIEKLRSQNISENDVYQVGAKISYIIK